MTSVPPAGDDCSRVADFSRGWFFRVVSICKAALEGVHQGAMDASATAEERQAILREFQTSCRPEVISGLWFRVIPASLAVRAAKAFGERFVEALELVEMVYFRGDFYLAVGGTDEADGFVEWFEQTSNTPDKGVNNENHPRTCNTC